MCTLTFSINNCRHIKIFPKNFKSTELNRCKKYRNKTSWMKLLNWCKKYMNKSVHLTITVIIINHTHAPLQLCIVAPLLCSPSESLQIVIRSDNTKLQWCMVWLIIILVIVSCSYNTFYTSSAISSNLFSYFLHLFNSVYLFKFFICMSSFTSFLLSPGLISHYNCLHLMLFVQCTHGVMVFL